MSLRRTLEVLRKDLALGPRSPVFLWAIVLPFAMTLVLQFAFGSLFDPQPRLGIVDEGDSAITAAVGKTEGIELTLLDDPDELKARIEANDLDAGLVLPAGFDAEVRAGDRPDLQFYIGGESLASNRIILSVTAIDLIREIEGGEAPVEVKVVDFGEEGLPISVRLVPIIVFYALVIAGIFVTGSNLVEEKERGTLTAMLVTPAKPVEVLAAKWAMGTLLASVMAVVTLLLNRAIGSNWPDAIFVVLVAGAMSSMLGLLIGTFAKDSTVMFGIVKGLGIFLFAPTLFYIFPDWPQWIAKLFPLYWIIEPIWRVSIMGGSILEVWGELTVAVGITIALVPLVGLVARRVREQLAAG